MNSQGNIIYENPSAKRLLFETTDRHFDKHAGDPSHSYHYSFFWSFATAGENVFDALLENDAIALRSSSDSVKESTRNDNRRFGINDNGMHEEQDVVCKRTNGTEFAASLRLSKLGQCPCCENQILMCGYVKPKSDHNYMNNPFAKEGTSLKCILNASFDPVLSIDEYGSILMCNEAATKVFGWTNQELVGSNIKIICGGGHAASHDQYLQNYRDTGIKKIIGKKREVPARRKDRSEFSMELGVQEVSCEDYGIDGKTVFCAFLKDLSSEKKHSQEMKLKADLMQGMINSSFDPMFQINEEGIIQNFNDAACHLFGYRRDELVGRNVSIICGKEHAAKHDIYIQAYLRTGQKNVIGRKRQVDAVRKDGKELKIELGVQEVESPDGKLFCGYIRDLTSRHLERRRVRRAISKDKKGFFENRGDKPTAPENGKHK